jgi:hypothetical protein
MEQQKKAPRTVDVTYYVRPRHDKAARFEVVNSWGIVISVHKNAELAAKRCAEYNGETNA